MTERREPGVGDPVRILGAPPLSPVLEQDALREELERALFFTKADSLIGWAVNQSRANSIWPLGFGLACCAIEMMATLGPGFDISRMGAEVMKLLTMLNHEGITVIIVTHSNEYAHCARRLIRLLDGRLVNGELAM